jgi:hypothetical protein
VCNINNFGINYQPIANAQKIANPFTTKLIDVCYNYNECMHNKKFNKKLGCTMVHGGLDLSDSASSAMNSARWSLSRQEKVCLHAN